MRLDEIYSNPNLPPASPAANRATDDVFALYERLMQYHTGILIQRTGWSRAQVNFCRGIWNHVSQSYDCIGIEKMARHNLELGIPPRHGTSAFSTTALILTLISWKENSKSIDKLHPEPLPG